jgi:Ca2+-binding RTX toxin-like protein
MPVGARNSDTSYSTDPYLGTYIAGWSWSWAPSESRTLKYTFNEWTGPTYDGSILNRVFSEPLKDMIGQTFRAYADVIDVKFEEVPLGQEAQMVMNLYPVRGVGNSGMLFTGATNTWTSFSDGWLNLQGYSLYFMNTALHEIGHALGLGHPFNFPGANGEPWNPGDNGLASQFATVMAYHGVRATITPMAFDIAAFQKIYGANMTTRAGDDIYDMDESGAMRCIWDVGGIDTIRYTGNKDVIIDLVAATLDNSPTGGGAPSYIVGTVDSNVTYIANGVVIENAQGGSGNDWLVANDAVNVLNGGDGIDTANYFRSREAVNITLDGGPNSGGLAAGDIFVSIENLHGSGHDDTITGNAGVNSLYGAVGNDTIYGGAGDDMIYGGAGADQLFGGEGMDTIDFGSSSIGVSVNLSTGQGLGGEAEGDTYSGIEQVLGSSGNDTLIGTDAADRLFGGLGVDALFGGNGNDWLGTGLGTIDGGAGDDFIESFVGAAIINGGDGIDTLSYRNSNLHVNVDLNRTDGQRLGWAHGDVISNVENLIGSERFNDHLIGNAADNTISGLGGNDYIDGSLGADQLFGGNGNDTLHGGAGNDTIVGGAGADMLFGGEGIDTLDYSASTTGVSVDLWSNRVSGGEAEGDVIVGFEQIIGTSSNDILFAGVVGRFIDAGQGNDWLAIHAGTALGGEGDDFIDSYAGAAVIDGGSGIDTVSYFHSEGGVRVNLTLTGAQQGGFAHGDILSGIENLVGSERFGDELIGNSLDNTLTGLGGDDLINGGSGADRLFGGSGADRLHGGLGDDAIHGEDGNDLLYGWGGDDIIFGGRGSDAIWSAAGNDTIYGGEARDIFIFEAGGGRDVIADFQDGIDRINIQQLNLNRAITQHNFTSTVAINAIAGTNDFNVTIGDVSFIVQSMNGERFTLNIGDFDYWI